MYIPLAPNVFSIPGPNNFEDVGTVFGVSFISARAQLLVKSTPPHLYSSDPKFVLVPELFSPTNCIPTPKLLVAVPVVGCVNVNTLNVVDDIDEPVTEITVEPVTFNTPLKYVKFEDAVAAFVVPSDKIIRPSDALFIVEKPVPDVPFAPDVPVVPDVPDSPLVPDDPDVPDVAAVYDVPFIIRSPTISIDPVIPYDPLNCLVFSQPSPYFTRRSPLVEFTSLTLSSSPILFAGVNRTNIVPLTVLCMTAAMINFQLPSGGS